MNVVTQTPYSSSVVKGTPRKFLSCLAALSLIASVAVSQAQQMLNIHFADTTSSWDWQAPIVQTNGGWGINDHTYIPSGAGVSLTLSNVTVSLDPFITTTVDVTNQTGITQNFIVTVSMSLSLAGPTVSGGSTQGGITDGDGLGATLSTLPGKPLYYGEIDGVDVLPLYPDPMSISAPGFGSATVPATNAFLPPSLPTGPVASSIGIKTQFSLTSGDRATFTSSFVVEPVPEPATLSLLAVGGLAVVLRRRR